MNYRKFCDTFIPNPKKLSQKWTLGPYAFAIWNVYGFGFEFFLLDKTYAYILGKKEPEMKHGLNFPTLILFRSVFTIAQKRFLRKHVKKNIPINFKWDYLCILCTK